MYAAGPGLICLSLRRGLLDLLRVGLNLFRIGLDWQADSPVSSPRRPARSSWKLDCLGEQESCRSSLRRGLLDLLGIELEAHANSAASSHRRAARWSWNRTKEGVVPQCKGPRQLRIQSPRASKRTFLRFASSRTASTKRRRSKRRWPCGTTDAKTRSATTSRSTRAQSRQSFTKLLLSIVSWPALQ